ncbi:MAG: NADH-quinone oxidoreductase subunit C [Pseudomonadota bacterium]
MADMLAPQDETLDELADMLANRLGVEREDMRVDHGHVSIALGLGDLLSAVRTVRDDPQLGFVNIIDICGVDHPARERRFDVVYHFLSPTQNARLRLTVQTCDRTPVPSLTELFPGADWFEREAYDMYGILFSGHPDLRRLLTDYGFDGYPLRKDFPLTGFVEVRYDDEQKRVLYEPVRLNQEFRDFDFVSPWEGTDYVIPGDEKATDEKAG